MRQNVSESESRLLRNYLPEFLNKINPNIWIENYVNNVFDSRLHREDIKQTALFNVVKCLVIDDRNNCKSLLEIAEHMYREIPPATVSPNKGDHDVTETTSQ